MDKVLTADQICDLFLKMLSLLSDEAKQELEEYIVNLMAAKIEI